MFTLQEVKSKIYEAKLKRDFLHEMTPANSYLLKQKGEGSFEAVYTGRGEEKCLIPEVGTLHFLYRGQNRESVPCLPSIYRNNPSEAQIFLNRMRLVSFKHLLNSHPVVSEFFNKHNFKINTEGLAQHYGIRTSVLDLTSNLDIALFFAVCKYNSSTDGYEFFDDGKEHDAILYIFSPILDNEPSPSIHFDEYLNHNITPIGLQAFPRPGAQQGYSLRLRKGESVKAWMYRFTFTCADSKHYYDLFESGEKIWIKDYLIDKTKMIASQTRFSYSTFDETFEAYRPKGYSKTKLKKELRGIAELEKNWPDIVFDEEEQEAIIQEWNTNLGAKMAAAIRRKPWFEMDGVEDSGDDKFPKQIKGIRNKNDYRTLKRISEMQMLIFVSAPNGPEGAEWVNYQNSPRPKDKLREDNGKWKKIPASMETLFGKTYLTEDDWRINI